MPARSSGELMDWSSPLSGQRPASPSSSLHRASSRGPKRVVLDGLAARHTHCGGAFGRAAGEESRIPTVESPTPILRPKLRDGMDCCGAGVTAESTWALVAGRGRHGTTESRKPSRVGLVLYFAPARRADAVFAAAGVGCRGPRGPRSVRVQESGSSPNRGGPHRHRRPGRPRDEAPANFHSPRVFTATRVVMPAPAICQRVRNRKPRAPIERPTTTVVGRSRAALTAFGTTPPKPWRGRNLHSPGRNPPAHNRKAFGLPSKENNDDPDRNWSASPPDSPRPWT